MQLEQECLARAASKSKSCSGGERKYGTYPERNRQFVEQIGNPKVTPTLIFNLKSSRNDTKQMNNKNNSFFPFYKH